MATISAGIVLYRRKTPALEVLLVHPGGPFWKNKDAGAWSIPKGEVNDGEESLSAAIRELYEETGWQLTGDFLPLAPVRLKSGKKIYAWAHEGDGDAAKVKSNLFEIEWPPRTGKFQSFPEIDKAGWFTLKEAKEKINAFQAALLDDLYAQLTGRK